MNTMNDHLSKQVLPSLRHRAILGILGNHAAWQPGRRARPSPRTLTQLPPGDNVKRGGGSLPQPGIFKFLLCCAFLASAGPSHAATVTGKLTDVSLAPLNTKIVFSPTTDVLITPYGLSAGPPRIIDTTNGAFSIQLDEGD